MPISYDVENDHLYLRGIEKGIEKGTAKSAWKFFKVGQSIKFISETLEISIPQVKKYIKEWEEKS